MTHNTLLNLVLFNICWFVCVYAGSTPMVWLPPVALLLFFCINARFSASLRIDGILALVSLLCGAVLEVLWSLSGWIAYPQGGAVPLWMLCLWIAFALTLNSSMAWLQARPMLCALMCLAAAPMCYLTGARLGAVTFIDQIPFLVAVALVWAIVIPALLLLAARLVASSSEKEFV